MLPYPLSHARIGLRVLNDMDSMFYAGADDLIGHGREALNSGGNVTSSRIQQWTMEACFASPSLALKPLMYKGMIKINPLIKVLLNISCLGSQEPLFGTQTPSILTGSWVRGHGLDLFSLPDPESGLRIISRRILKLVSAPFTLIIGVKFVGVLMGL